MMTAGLTARQAQALLFIAARLDGGGLSPTLSEISAHLGIKGRSSVHAVLRGLRDRGRITWQRRLARSIRLVPQAPGVYTLPPATQLALARFCLAHQQHGIGDVVADAVLLHLDTLKDLPPESQRLEG